MVIGHTDHFIKPALPELKRRGHVVWRDQRSEPKALRENLNNADIVFCEWASRKAVKYSRQPKGSAKLVIRAHEGEMWNAPARCRAIKWRSVDLLLMPSPGTYHKLIKVAPKAKKVPVVWVGNPVPVDKYPLIPKKKYGHWIGQLGRVIQKKGNLEAVEWFEALTKQDARWHLSIRGWKNHDYGRRVAQAAQGLRVELLPKGNGLLEWFGRMDIITSLSRREAFHRSILEGMACGCWPIVLRWREAPGGAEWVYPKWCIVQNRRRWVQACRRWAAHSAEKKAKLSLQARQWVIDKHSVPVFCDRFEAALEKML